MLTETLLKKARNVVTLDRARSEAGDGLKTGEAVYLSDDLESWLKLRGFASAECDGRWTILRTATIDLQLACESKEIAYLRLHVMPFVSETNGQTLQLRCGGVERVVEFPPRTGAWTIVDLPLADSAERCARIELTVGHTFVPSELGLSDDTRTLGVKIGQIELIRGTATDLATEPSSWKGAPLRRVRSLLNRIRNALISFRDFLNRPTVVALEELKKRTTEDRLLLAQHILGQLTDLVNENPSRQALHVDALSAEFVKSYTAAEGNRKAQLDAHQIEGSRLTNLGLTELNTVIEAIQALPTRSEVQGTEARLTGIAQISDQFLPLLHVLHEKTDIIANRFVVPVDADTVLVKSSVGYVYCGRNDHSVLTTLADSGEFEPGLRRLLERVLESGMTFLDVGAHLGLHTLAAARRVGATGKVFSFEPTPATNELLGRTLRLNGLDNCVTVWRTAVSNQDAQVTLYIGAISGHNSLYPLSNPKDAIEVEGVRLDSALPAETRVDAVKIDVEGAELDVLRGMSRVIAENPGILIVAEYGPSHLLRTGVAPRDWLSAFTDQGFEGFVIEEPAGKCVPIKQVDLSRVFSANIVFVRSSSPLRSRVAGDDTTLPGVVVIGAGGHAKVVVELIRAEGRYHVVGCTDLAPTSEQVVGAPVLGNDGILPELYAKGVKHCFIALGDNYLRRKVAASVAKIGFELISAVSPSAIVSPTARIGRGVAVMPGAVINAAATIKNLAIINTHAVVDHDCDIGEAAHVAPRATLAGSVRLGPLAFVGAGATIIPEVSIGAATIVGAGATVTSDLGPNLVAVGVPAKPIPNRTAGRMEEHDDKF